MATMKIAYLGDDYSHSYAAATACYADETFIGYPTLSKVIDAVSDGAADAAVLPFENNLGGAVTECIDKFVTAGVYINKQFFLPIHHSLVGLEGANKDIIKSIYSHPQGLSQCAEYIKRNYSTARLYPLGSTSEALGTLKELSEAAIARCALKGQIVLAADIEDNNSNTTRFVAVSREQTFEGDTVSVIFESKHEPGALNDALAVFSTNGLNLLKIESRPQRDASFRYWFYVEFMCGYAKKELLVFLSKLAEKTGSIKFIGKY